MKRRIAIICCIAILAMTMLGVLVACKDKALDDESLMVLRSAVLSQYREDPAEQTKNYKVWSEVKAFSSDGKEIKAAIKWEIEGTDKVTVSEKGGDGYYTIIVPDQLTLTEDISYTLKGTLVDSKGNAYKGYNDDKDATYTVKFSRTISRIGGGNGNDLLTHYLPNAVTNPTMNTEYNLSLYDGSVNLVYYFKGTTSGANGIYLATSDKVASSVKVKLESATGGFYVTYDDNGTKKYVNFVDATGATDKNAKANISVTTSPSTVFTMDPGINGGALKASIDTTVDGYTSKNVFYLGGRPGYGTISATSAYYVTGSNAGNIDGTQCVARLIASDTDLNTPYGGLKGDEDALARIRNSAAADPQEGVAYKLGVYKVSKYIYFTGTMSGYYFAVNQTKANGVDVYVEKSGDGFYMYFMAGSTKNYIYIELSGTHVNAKFGATKPSEGALFKMDSTLVVPCTEINGAKYYLFSDGTYNSIGGGTWSKMNQETVDTSSWVARLFPADAEEVS